MPSLELQAALPGGVGQGLHPAVIQVSAAVEDDPRDAGVPRALRDEAADGGRPLGARRPPHVLLEARRGRNRPAGGVVDELRIDPLVRAVHGEARALRVAGDLLAHAAMTALAQLLLGAHAHARLPTFRTTCSPA